VFQNPFSAAEQRAAIVHGKTVGKAAKPLKAPERAKEFLISTALL
jgi:hypothetical protein